MATRLKIGIREAYKLLKEQRETSKKFLTKRQLKELSYKVLKTNKPLQFYEKTSNYQSKSLKRNPLKRKFYKYGYSYKYDRGGGITASKKDYINRGKDLNRYFKKYKKFKFDFKYNEALKKRGGLKTSTKNKLINRLYNKSQYRISKDRFISWDYQRDIKPYGNLRDFSGLKYDTDYYPSRKKYRALKSVTFSRIDENKFLKALGRAETRTALKEEANRRSIGLGENLRNFLLKNNIPHHTSDARTGSTYITVGGKTYRFADHGKGKSHFNWKTQSQVTYEKSTWVKSSNYIERLKKTLLKKYNK